MTNTISITEVPNLVPYIIFEDDRDVQNATKIGGDTRQPTVEHLPISQLLHGPHDSKRIQKPAVKFIEECCGPDILK